MFKFLFVPLLVASNFCAGLAYSATDGTVGATSTGSTTISITIPTLVRITDVQNLNLGTFTGSGDLVADDSVCIYTNLAAATYKVTAVGNGLASAFTLKNAANDIIPYSVFWNDQPNASGGVELSTGVASGTQDGANTNSQTCVGPGNNANFRVRVLEASLLASPPEVYTGTLSLLIEPI